MPRVKKVQTSSLENNEVQTSALDNNDYAFSTEGLDLHTKAIKKSINEISKHFIFIANRLWNIRFYEMYKGKGYKDIVEYSEKELNFKRRSTYNFISIAEHYLNFENGYPTLELKEEYKEYKYSQLTEMLSLSEEQKKTVNPDMTIKDIRETKKNTAESKENIVDVKFDDVEEEKVSRIYEENVDFKDKMLDYLNVKLKEYKDFRKSLKKTDELFNKVTGKIDAFEEILIDIKDL